MDQFPDFGPKSKRSSQVRSNVVGDKNEGLGDIRTPMRGFDIVLYHYRKKNMPRPICNPWTYKIGKLAVPNVFVNTNLMTALIKSYDLNTKTIKDAIGKILLPITRDFMSGVFDLDIILDQPIDPTILTNEYTRLTNKYKIWRLPIHRQKEGNKGNFLKKLKTLPSS